MKRWKHEPFCQNVGKKLANHDWHMASLWLLVNALATIVDTFDCMWLDFAQYHRFFGAKRPAFQQHNPERLSNALLGSYTIRRWTVFWTLCFHVFFRLAIALAKSPGITPALAIKWADLALWNWASGCLNNFEDRNTSAEKFQEHAEYGGNCRNLATWEHHKMRKSVDLISSVDQCTLGLSILNLRSTPCPKRGNVWFRSAYHKACEAEMHSSKACAAKHVQQSMCSMPSMSQKTRSFFDVDRSTWWAAAWGQPLEPLVHATSFQSVNHIWLQPVWQPAATLQKNPFAWICWDVFEWLNHLNISDQSWDPGPGTCWDSS